MFIEDLIIKLSNMIENKINQSILIAFQEYLLKAGIFTLASQILAIILMVNIAFIILFLLVSLLLSFNLAIALVLAIFIPTVAFILILFLKIEKRASEIENSIPDFLRQLSSMLKVGLSLENALVDMSGHGKGPLYDELRRVVVEIRMGKSLDESFSNMAMRLNSKDLERSFKIILNAHKSGGSLSDIILDVSDDLRAMLVLKRERKASVMMSIMFLIIASTIAAPFALGMVGVYSSFMIELGKGGAICEVAPLAAEIYLIIHSILAGFLIALIMYGDLKKGLRYSIPITCSAFSVFYLINNFGAGFFGLT
jgi:flagellar protein FlaJ